MKSPKRLYSFWVIIVTQLWIVKTTWYETRQERVTVSVMCCAVHWCQFMHRRFKCDRVFGDAEHRRAGSAKVLQLEIHKSTVFKFIDFSESQDHQFAFVSHSFVGINRSTACVWMKSRVTASFCLKKEKSHTMSSVPKSFRRVDHLALSLVFDVLQWPMQGNQWKKNKKWRTK